LARAKAALAETSAGDAGPFVNDGLSAGSCRAGQKTSRFRRELPGGGGAVEVVLLPWCGGATGAPLPEARNGFWQRDLDEGRQRQCESVKRRWRGS
jgi:hypothetical protein